MMRHLILICCLSANFVLGTASAEDRPLAIAKLEVGAQSERSTPPEFWEELDPKDLKLRSAAALVVDSQGNEVFAKRADKPLPIASITKLMTAVVVLDADLPLQERITITRNDRDLIRLTGSRLGFGARLSREELLRLALMASDNRAANALARTYPGGREAFLEAQNRKAMELGMHDSRFADPAGLDAANVASARDLVKLVRAAHAYPLIREATSQRSLVVYPYKGRGPLRFGNTNRLLRNERWEIQLSKTGYHNEAGRCLAMRAEIADQPLVIVLLNSFGKLTPFGDSNRIRKWIEREIQG